MKKSLPIILCLCLLLSACGAQEQIPGTTNTSQTTNESTVDTSTQNTQESTVDTTEDTTETTEGTTTTEVEPELLYTHPLTGEPLAEMFTARPVGVTINNISHAQPLHGLSNVDVLYEIVAEGGGTITRLMAIYTDLASAGKVGSIRSARTYMIDLARTFQAPIVHCGYSEFAQQELWNTGYDSFNQFFYPDYFYRDQDRRNKGYALEHTLFAEGADLMKGLTENGFDMVNEDGTDFGLQFASEIDLDGEAATKISFRFYSSGGKQTVMTYDEEDGVYYGTQIWGKQTGSFADANTGTDIPFRNVLLLYAETTLQYTNKETGSYRMFSKLTGEGTGYFACDRKIVPIKWYREDKNAPFSYTLEDGTPITLGIGKTYVGIIPTRYPNIEYS